MARSRPTEEQILGRVRAAVKSSPLLQRDIAAHLEIDASAFSRALHGHRRFTPLEIALLAEITGGDPSYLLWGDAAPAPTGLTRPRSPEPASLDFTPIRRALAEQCITQQDYALALGITPKHVSRILNGIDTPQVRLLVQMARQLGMEWTVAAAPATYTDEMSNERAKRLDEVAAYYLQTDVSAEIAAAEWDTEVRTHREDPSSSVRGRGIPARRPVVEMTPDECAAELADDARRGGY